MAKSPKLSKKDMRELAIYAARGELRHLGIDPETAAVDDAFKVLDELTFTRPTMIAAIWYEFASDNQIKAFKKEWRQWQKQAKQQKASTEQLREMVARWSAEEDYSG
jgi:hypothetical protein